MRAAAIGPVRSARAGPLRRLDSGPDGRETPGPKESSEMASAELDVTERTRLRRLHQRGHFDRETIHAILDATPLCHVGYLIEGRPSVTPTLQWREGETVYWHGSSASRAL